MSRYHNDIDFLLNNHFDTHAYNRSKEIYNSPHKISHKSLFNQASKESELSLDMLVNIKTGREINVVKNNIVYSGVPEFICDPLFLPKDKNYNSSKLDFIINTMTAKSGLHRLWSNLSYYTLTLSKESKEIDGYNIDYQFSFASNNIFLSQMHKYNDTEFNIIHNIKFSSSPNSRGNLSCLNLVNNLNDNICVLYHPSAKKKSISFYDDKNISTYSFSKKKKNPNSYYLSEFSYGDVTERRAIKDSSKYFEDAVKISFTSMSSPNRFKIDRYDLLTKEEDIIVQYTPRGELSYKKIIDINKNPDIAYYIVWYRNGNVKSYGLTRLMGREGPFIMYNTDGSIKYKEYYRFGTRYGIGTYYKKGKVYKIVDYCTKRKGIIIYKDDSL